MNFPAPGAVSLFTRETSRGFGDGGAEMMQSDGKIGAPDYAGVFHFHKFADLRQFLEPSSRSGDHRDARPDQAAKILRSRNRIGEFDGHVNSGKRSRAEHLAIVVFGGADDSNHLAAVFRREAFDCAAHLSVADNGDAQTHSSARLRDQLLRHAGVDSDGVEQLFFRNTFFRAVRDANASVATYELRSPVAVKIRQL